MDEKGAEVMDRKNNERIYELPQNVEEELLERLYKKLIESLPPLKSPYLPDEKVFKDVDEDGNEIGEPYSYNDWIKKIESFSGVSPELLGE